MRERDLFDAALAIADPAERSAYLAEACAGDAGLRQHIEGLLQMHQQLGSFLEAPAPAPAATVDIQPVGARPGTVIGPYKLLEQIGEGGMGTVFMAEQTQPVRRKVALKVIKPGMDSGQVLARFEAERQALALMDHPNIAKVLDAGYVGQAFQPDSSVRQAGKPDLQQGRPYFVMELVKGQPITRYCDEQRLSVRERLRLFVSVCQAVQHAHQKGVIHRDLKPSNVLVGLYDGVPVVKVIDFGVAKAAGEPLTERTLATGFGALVGTPEYMSPEQARLDNVDVDTRSDVYALGVLLYELLTGTTPLTRQRVKAAALLEVLRLVREEEPPAPSARLSTTAELPAIAASRGVEPRRLSGLVKGELDWVVLRALEKDRNRRYETANSLAQDLERYLGDEPVLACPPSAAYRFRKFARRHRAAMAVAGAVLAALLLTVVGLAISTALVWQAKNEAVRAFESEEWSSYRQRIALAEREWSANNLLRVQELLALCPEKHRGWEWRYLRRLPGKAMEPLWHDHQVRRVAVSPDGKRIVSADMGGFVKVWDATTGALLQDFRGHDQGIIGLAFSPNGECFATCVRDFSGRRRGELKVWQVQPRKELMKWGGQNSDVSWPRFLSAGILAFGTRNKAGDSVTMFLDPRTGKVLSTLGDSTKAFTPLPSTPANKLLVGGKGKVWDLQTGKHVRTLEGADGEGHYSTASSWDSRLVAAAFFMPEKQGNRRLIVWEVQTGRKRLELQGFRGTSVAFHPDGSRLATGGSGNAVKILDAATGQEVLTLRGQSEGGGHLVFTPDGHRLVSVAGKKVLVWDARPLDVGEKIGQELFTLEGHGDSVTAVAFHPTEPLLATGGADGVVKLWDTQTGKEARPFSLGLLKVDKVQTLAFSPDGKRLAVAGEYPMTAAILDAATGKVVLPLKWPRNRRGDWMRKVAFSPDGKTLAVAANGGAVFLYDASTGAEVGELPGHYRAIFDVAFHPDPGKHLLVSADTATGAVRAWRTKSHTELPDFRLRHQGSTCAVSFSRDGRLLATGGGDRMVRVWDTTTWKQVDAWRDQTGSVQCLAFSPDGRLIAWGSSDSTVKVWQRDSSEVVTLRGHADVILGVAFSPDGTRIASGSNDGTARIWETSKLP